MRNQLLKAELPAAEVATASPQSSIGEVRSALRGMRITPHHDLVVVEKGDRVAGLLPLRKFLAAPPDALVSEVMDPDPPLARPGGDSNLAAHRMVERGHSSVVVADDSGRLHGLVPPQEMISILLHEHDEDMARLGGYVAGARRARGAAREPVSRRLIHRLPWLALGLLGAMLSAVIVGAFEDRLAQNLLVALFVPAVVYMADAVGTQTEALLIRAMASGVTVRSMVAREVGTGAIVGGVVGLSMALFAFAGWSDGRLALAVGIALFASCVIATLLAMGFPALLDRLGQDPAFGSGPLATVAQDLLSILVYFAAVVLVGA